jgi:hypothetical protein
LITAAWVPGIEIGLNMKPSSHLIGYGWIKGEHLYVAHRATLGSMPTTCARA